jgi:endonuclease/exonuclease/phosphatase (EEP) superfamily protein YafD
MVVLEPSTGWLLEVRRHTGYEMRVLPAPGTPKVLLLAAVPVTNIRHPTEPGLPETALVFEVELGGRPVTVLAVHVPAPTTPGDRRARDEELGAVGRWARSHRGSEIVLGDFNATPWSSVLERLEDTADLRNSTEGFGVQASWPALAGPLGIPIDQLLHSRDLTVTGREVGRGYGSDHRTLWVTLARAREG